MTLHEIENAIAELTPAEKNQLLSQLRRDVGIERRADVMGGDACIAGTRIPVWLLASLKAQGATEADLLLDYPSINAEDLAAAWAYAEANAEEIQAAIRAHETA
jgi:uncharacterized protein (DUF433 family)